MPYHLSITQSVGKPDLIQINKIQAPANNKLHGRESFNGVRFVHGSFNTFADACEALGDRKIILREWVERDAAGRFFLEYSNKATAPSFARVAYTNLEQGRYVSNLLPMSDALWRAWMGLVG